MSDTPPAPVREPPAAPKRTRGRPRAARPRGANDVKQVGVAAAPREDDQDRRPGLRDQNSDEPLRRLTRGERMERDSSLPSHLTRPGYIYQWWPVTVQGQPAQDLAPQYHPSEIQSGGWRPEKARDWIPDVMPSGTNPDDAVIRQGQMLYSRPEHLSKEARAEDYDIANRQQRDRMMASAAGKSARSSESGLADVRGVRTHALTMEIEAEVGTAARRQ